MNEPNKNPANQPEKIKLVFDVMPQAQAPAETAVEAKTMDVPPPPPPAAEAVPKISEELLPPPAGADGGGFEEKARWRMPKLSLNFKWVGIAGAVVVLVVAGYFGYRYYQNFQTSPTEADPLLQRPAENVISSMPEEWLVKYFANTDCETEICAPVADPDSDGATNSQEQTYSTDPNNPDSDYDGLSDSDEVQVYATDPRVADTDGDGFEDGVEVRNGYSPSLGGHDKISLVENQVIADNLGNYGLHEPTTTFLSLASFKTDFKFSTSTLPQLSLGIPKDWLRSASTTAGQIIFESLGSEARIDIQRLGEGYVYGSIPQSKSWQRKLGDDIGYYEDAVLKNGAGHVRRVIFWKASEAFSVSFIVVESKWAALSNLAQVVINAAR